MMGVCGDYILFDHTRLFGVIRGEGQPILLLHGGFTDHRIWEYQCTAFAGQYQVICYDQRGYGHSDIPDTPFAYYEDLKSVLDALKIPKAAIVGSSFGGSVAIDFALKYPERVTSLILVCPALNGYKYPLNYIFAYLKFLSEVKKKGFPEAIEKFIENPFWSYFFPADQASAREKLLQIIRSSERSFSWNPGLVRILRPLAAKRLQEIDIPTLIILSDLDSCFNQKAGEYIHQRIKGSEKTVIPGCGHLPCLEKPEEFNKIVSDFITRSAARRENPWNGSTE